MAIKVTRSLTVIALCALCVMGAPCCSDSSGEPAPLGNIVIPPRARDAGAGSTDGEVVVPSDADAASDVRRPDAGANPIVTQECSESNDENLCHQCEDERCCETYAAYLDVPEAAQLKECIQACYGLDADPPTEAACLLECNDRFPGAMDVWAPRATCLVIQCAEPCGAPPSECTQCQVDECASQWADAQGTAQGFLFGICSVGCADHIACVFDCSERYPEANESSAAWTDCVSAYCPICLQSS